LAKCNDKALKMKHLGIDNKKFVIENEKAMKVAYLGMVGTWNSKIKPAKGHKINFRVESSNILVENDRVTNKEVIEE